MNKSYRLHVTHCHRWQINEIRIINTHNRKKSVVVAVKERDEGLDYVILVTSSVTPFNYKIYHSRLNTEHTTTKTSRPSSPPQS